MFRYYTDNSTAHTPASFANIVEREQDGRTAK